MPLHVTQTIANHDLSYPEVDTQRMSVQSADTTVGRLIQIDERDPRWVVDVNFWDSGDQGFGRGIRLTPDQALKVAAKMLHSALVANTMNDEDRRHVMKRWPLVQPGPMTPARERAIMEVLRDYLPHAADTREA